MSKHIIFILLNLHVIGGVDWPLEAPDYSSFKVTAIRPPALLVVWGAVTFGYPNPIIGYKVRVWQVPTETHLEYNLVNAEQFPGLIEDSKPLNPFITNETIKAEPKEVIVIGPENRQALIDNLDYNILYEVRVLAFKAKEDGPMTAPRWVKILENPKMVVQRQVDACFVSIRSYLNASQTSETYPLYYESYF